LILPVRLRRVASGLMMDRVRSIAIGVLLVSGLMRAAD
jgi:tetrahydromethanopterin S-methyltransferase subunit F